MNYQFNLEEWLPKFPLEAEHGQFSACGVSSPSSICRIEQLRREMVDEYFWEEPEPADVFIMAKGESPRREATKIGGLPYRPAKQRWPKTPSGKPLALIAQFNFSDSFDIVGELPGDLLLVFSDNSRGGFNPIHLEWQSLGINNLVQPHQVPADCMKIPPTYGYRHRMWNYPRAQRRTDSKYPMCRGLEVSGDYYIPCVQATQIGPAPFLVHREECREFPSEYLCAVSGNGPALNKPYPWINVPEPIAFDFSSPSFFSQLCELGLSIGDAGCIYIARTEDGEFRAFESSG